MAENNIMKDPQFQREQARAAAIGKYAVYRYTYIALSQRADYRKLKADNMLWTHLKTVQDTVKGYIDHFIKYIINSERFRAARARDEEKAAKMLSKAVEDEEERIGNRWICVKNPYELKDFCRWSEAAAVCSYRTRKEERLKRNFGNDGMISGFNKYGEYSVANVRNGEVSYPLEQLYKAIYEDIKTLEEESLSADERADLLHKRRELEDMIYDFMKMREDIERSYKILK